jgi:hypothetical protein
MIDYEITYSRESKDYDCYVDGRYIGSRATYTMGDTLCRQVVADLIADGLALTAAELDGPIDDDVPAPEPGDTGPVYEGPSPL